MVPVPPTSCQMSAKSTRRRLEPEVVCVQFFVVGPEVKPPWMMVVVAERVMLALPPPEVMVAIGAPCAKMCLVVVAELVQAKGEDDLLEIDAIADAYWALHSQPRSAWTHELDLRPFKEPF